MRRQLRVLIATVFILGGVTAFQSDALAQKGSSHSSSSHSTSSHSSSKGSKTSGTTTSTHSSSSHATSTHSSSTGSKTGATTTSHSSSSSASGKKTTTHHNANYCATCARDKNGKILRGDEAKDAFKKQTGYPKGRPGYVIDHIRPLACGGADHPSNMQWQTVAAAKAKDRTERRGCR